MSKFYRVPRHGWRYVGVGLALVLIVAMLAGCAQVPQPPPPEAPAEAAQPRKLLRSRLRPQRWSSRRTRK